MNDAVKQLAAQNGARFRVLMSGDNQVVFTEDQFYRFADNLVCGCIEECHQVGNNPPLFPQTRRSIVYQCVDRIIKRWRNNG